ncbi:MAG TPA: hypothetical protein VEI97_04505, partial [bacterium]|nr:hypothetical protein [bacterium]
MARRVPAAVSTGSAKDCPATGALVVAPPRPLLWVRPSLPGHCCLVELRRRHTGPAHLVGNVEITVVALARGIRTGSSGCTG